MLVNRAASFIEFTVPFYARPGRSQRKVVGTNLATFRLPIHLLPVVVDSRDVGAPNTGRVGAAERERDAERASEAAWGSSGGGQVSSFHPGLGWG